MAKRKVFSIGSSLSEGLEQTIAAAHNYSSALRVDVIPLKKIEPDPSNPRVLALTLYDAINGLATDDPLYIEKKQEFDSLQSLASSIETQGIINPVIVYEFNGMYRLIAGERRTLASAIAKKTDIQAKILDEKPNEVKIRILPWIENIERADLLLSEKLDNLEKIMEAFAKEKNISKQDITITDISKLIGCVKSHAINLKAVLYADEDIKTLIASNQIRSLEKAAVIANISSEHLRQIAIQECLNGATLKRLKSLLEQEKIKLKNVQHDIYVKSGRPTTAINFGKTQNIKVAGIILHSIIANPELSKLESQISNLDLENPKTISNAFNVLIRKLEALYE